jgi:hypothetical protein
MGPMFLLLIASLWLAQASVEFGDAEVNGVEITETTLQLAISVAVYGSDGPVVAHLILPGQAPEVRPLVEMSGGRWGTTLDLRKADWRLVFEDVTSGALSAEASLTELGLDPTLLGRGLPDEAESDAPTAAPATGSWLWLALAVVAAVLALVLYRRRPARPRHLRR